MSDTRVSAYRIYPGGRMELKEVDPEEISVLEDVEEMEVLLNQGNMVYIDQHTLEREWREMKHRNISRRCKSRVKSIPLGELDEILGELAWAKERGYVFQELEEHVTSAVLRRDLGR